MHRVSYVRYVAVGIALLQFGRGVDDGNVSQDCAIRQGDLEVRPFIGAVIDSTRLCTDW